MKKFLEVLGVILAFGIVADLIVTFGSAIAKSGFIDWILLILLIVASIGWFNSSKKQKELKSESQKLEPYKSKYEQQEKYKDEYVELKKKYDDLEKKSSQKLTVTQQSYIDLRQQVVSSSSKLQEINDKIDKSKKELSTLEEKIVSVSDKVEIESYGLYKPRYDFSNSSTFKARLDAVRNEQKSMIKKETAATIFDTLSLNGSASKGKAMQKKNIKQLIRSFNIECEAAINKVTVANIENIEKRITNSFKELNELNEPNGVRLSEKYLDSKLDETHIALEYELKKEEERDLLREQREREREEKIRQREVANARKKYEKDEIHITNVEAELTQKLQDSQDKDEIAKLKAEIQKLQDQLETVREHKEKLDTQGPTAGYVYIISNIGSFGQNVYKIGVTRRLDPMERINELGSASVPFKFDVHALIFSNDAYKLEAELHQYFDKKRVNMVNKRKEYFNITMDEIKEVLSRHKELTFDFNEVPAATEYRDTLKMKEQQK